VTAMSDNLHERFDREEKIESSSNRSFGMVFAAVFAIIGGWRAWYGLAYGWPALSTGAAFAAVALVAPAWLASLNRLWTRFGLLLGAIMAPVMLAILFYGVMLPIGVMMRIAGKHPLAVRHDPAATSYWIERRPPGPPPDSMRNQF
jgi:predicted membrane metal-binding protein